MARHPLPKNVSLLCGFVKKSVYEDLRLGFLISKIQQDRALCAAAELTYSRPALMTQNYYLKILDDLLGFHMLNARGLSEHWSREPFMESLRGSNMPLVHSAEVAMNHPAIKRSEVDIGDDAIRLDYGENFTYA